MFELAAMLTEKSGIAVVATIDEFLDILDYGFSEINAIIKHFREVVSKYFSQYVHVQMIQQNSPKEKPPRLGVGG